MAKTPTQSCLSPKGPLYWIFITGEGKIQRDKKARKFEASIRLKDDDPKLLAFEKEIKAFWKENKGAKKKPASTGIKKEYTRDDDGEKVYTGYSLIAFKTHTSFPDGKQKKIKVYNAAGKEVNMGDKLIGNDSVGYLSGAMGIYEDQGSGEGVTLYLNAVQLTKFLEYTGNTPLADDEDGWLGEDLNEDGIVPEGSKKPANLDLDEED